jgi:hypothetical protein
LSPIAIHCEKFVEIVLRGSGLAVPARGRAGARSGGRECANRITAVSVLRAHPAVPAAFQQADRMTGEPPDIGSDDDDGGSQYSHR